jgi:hypothetical protein
MATPLAFSRRIASKRCSTSDAGSDAVGSSNTRRWAPCSSQGHAGLLCWGEGTDGQSHVDTREPDGGECFPRALTIATPVDLSPTGGEPVAQSEVLDGREPVDEAQILVHEAQAVTLGRSTVTEFERLACRVVAEVHRSRVVPGRLVIAGEDLDQRRFSRTVLTDECMGGAGVDLEIDVVECDLAREHLRQVFDRQQRWHSSPFAASPAVRTRILTGRRLCSTPSQKRINRIRSATIQGGRPRMRRLSRAAALLVPLVPRR